MGTLYNFCKFLFEVFRNCAVFISTLPGIIMSGVVGFGSFFASVFTGFDRWTDLSNLVFNASVELQDAFMSITPPVQFLLSCLNLDTFVRVSVLALSITVGFSCLVFLSFFTAILVFLPLVYGFKMTLRIINVVSAGIVDV